MHVHNWGRTLTVPKPSLLVYRRYDCVVIIITPSCAPLPPPPQVLIFECDIAPPALSEECKLLMEGSVKVCWDAPWCMLRCKVLRLGVCPRVRALYPVLRLGVCPRVRALCPESRNTS